MSGQIIGPIGVLPTAAAATLTYTPTDITQAWNNTDTTSDTFTSVNIGPVASDRVVVVSLTVGAFSGSDAHPSSVTIGGLAMTLATSTLGEAASIQAGNTYIYWRLVTAADINATTANLVITATRLLNVAVMVGNITGSASATNNSSQGYSWSQVGTTLGTSAVTINTGGLAVSCASVDRNDPTSGSNVTVDLVNQNAGSFGYTQIAMHGTNVSPTVNIAGNFFTAMVTAAFQP